MQRLGNYWQIAWGHALSCLAAAQRDNRRARGIIHSRTISFVSRRGSLVPKIQTLDFVIFISLRVVEVIFVVFSSSLFFIFLPVSRFFFFFRCIFSDCQPQDLFLYLLYLGASSFSLLFLRSASSR